MDKDDENELITDLFLKGLSQNDIRTQLFFRYGVNITERSLKRRLQQLNLYRKKYFSPLQDVIQFISKEINQSGQNHGHKWLHLKCVKNGLVVTQETVRLCLLELDEEGVQLRKKRKLKRREYISKGPNFNWHVDGYDKLAPYGLCISGCIDGYSRLIIWLRVGETNKDSQVVHGYFLEAVENCNGIPVTVRKDPGVENVEIIRTQQILAESYSLSSRPPTMVAKSVGNQRIESWWCILRKEKAQYWMTFFEKFKYEGNFSGDFIDKSLVQFCFGKLLQRELDEVKDIWNSHRIRRNRMSNAPSGKPINMYYTPETYGTENCLVAVPEQEIRNRKQVNCKILEYPCEEDVFFLCCNAMAEESWDAPEDPEEAGILYLNLREKIRLVLDLN